MEWVAPTEKDAATDTLEKRLWDAADQFRANSGHHPPPVIRSSRALRCSQSGIMRRNSS